MAEQQASPEESFSALSDEELELSESALLAREDGSPVTDEEYERHYEYIRRVRRAQPSTHKQFTKRSRYSEERLKAHELVLSRLTKALEEIPREGRALFMGGMPGSGKSSILKLRPELLQFTYGAVDPDLVKHAMVAEGFQPEIPGLLPLETDELIRYEAGIIDAELLDRLIPLRTNLLIDRTMGSVQQIAKLVARLREHGYEDIQAIFMDISPEEGYRRIRARHRRGIDKHLSGESSLGERPVPGTAVMASRPGEGSRFKTSNAETFAKLVENETFDGYRIFDAVSLEELTLEQLQS